MRQSTRSYMRNLLWLRNDQGTLQRYLVERAIDHYIHNVIPFQSPARPKVMAAYRKSNAKFKDLYRKLAE